MLDRSPHEDVRARHQSPVTSPVELTEMGVRAEQGLTSQSLQPIEGTLPSITPNPLPLSSAILRDMSAAGIPQGRLISEACRGAAAEAIRWSGLYSLTVLALEATVNHSSLAIGFMGAFCGAFLLADHLDGTGKTAIDTLGRSYLRRLKERLIDTLGRSTLGALSNEETRSNLELQYDRASRISNLVEHSVALPAYATKIALSAGALLMVDWRVATLVSIAVLPGFLLRARHITADVELEDEQRRVGQIGDRIEGEAYRTDGAVRMILGGLTRPISVAITHLQSALDSERDRHERRQNGQLFVAYIGYYGAMFGGLVMLFNQYDSGAIAIGTFAFLCLQLKELGEELSNHGETYHNFKRVWEEARRFYQFVEPIAEPGRGEFPESHHLLLDHAVFSRGDFSITVPQLDVPRGSFVIVHGGSGAGKTTLLEHLAFASNPSAGAVSLGGVSIGEIRFSEWQRRIGYCGARTALLEGRTVREILRGSDESDDNLDARITHPLISELVTDLTRHHGLETRVGEGLEHGRGFSTGEQHRLLLVSALVPRPTLVFLDEVTSNQSDDFVTKVGAMLRDYCGKGTTVIFATHSKRFDSDATHILRVSGGTVGVTSTGTPQVTRAEELRPEDQTQSMPE